MNRTAAILALAGVLRGPFATAQGPDPHLLPADAAFVAHFDLQALVALVGEQRLRAILRDEDTTVDSVGLLNAAWLIWTGERGGSAQQPQQGHDEFDRVQREWGVNLLRDLHSVTLFASADPQSGAGVIVLASAAIDGALDRLRREGSLQVERHDGIEVERAPLSALLRMPGETAGGGRGDRPVWICVRPLEGERRAIAIGWQRECLVHAARVLSGELPSLAAAQQPPLALRPAPATIAYVEFLAVPAPWQELARDTIAARIGKDIHRVVLDLTGQRSEAALRVELDADSARAARRVARIVRGLRILGWLPGQRDVPAPVKAMVRRAKAKAKGNHVVIELSSRLLGLQVDETGRR